MKMFYISALSVMLVGTIHSMEENLELNLKLRSAMNGQSYEQAKLLIQQGANPDDLLDDYLDYESLKFLSDHGANFHKKLDFGRNLLHRACTLPSPPKFDALTLLISKGISVLEKSEEGKTPREYLEQRGNPVPQAYVKFLELTEITEQIKNLKRKKKAIVSELEEFIEQQKIEEPNCDPEK